MFQVKRSAYHAQLYQQYLQMVDIHLTSNLHHTTLLDISKRRYDHSL